jgi:predicted DCC family thiol-disulfide oxidoreductase YuxK
MVYELILLYDPECQLCSRFKKALEALDSKKMIRFNSVYDPAIYLEYPELDRVDCEEEIHLIDDNRKIYRGSEVIEKLLLSFPQVKKFAWLIDSESSKKAMNVFYKKLNQIRQMKKANCYSCGSKKRLK